MWKWGEIRDFLKKWWREIDNKRIFGTVIESIKVAEARKQANAAPNIHEKDGS